MMGKVALEFLFFCIRDDFQFIERFSDLFADWMASDSKLGHHVRFNEDSFAVSSQEQVGSTPAPSSERDDLVIINLDNFEEPWTENSRYVLTSPRSLGACSKFAIKPVDLLEKTMEDFVEEFPNVNRKVVQGMYEREERERQRRLRLVREERLVLLQKDQLTSSQDNFSDPDLQIRGSKVELTEHCEGIGEQNDFSTKESGTNSGSKILAEEKQDFETDVDTLELLRKRYQRELDRLANLSEECPLPQRKTTRVKSAPTQALPKSYFAVKSETPQVKVNDDMFSGHLEAAERIRAREAEKRREIEKRKLKEVQKKRQQELNRKKIENEKNQMNQYLEAELERRVDNAVYTKADIEKKEKLKRVVENAERELKHLENKKACDQQLWNSIDVKKNYLLHKHDQAKDRYLKVQMKKEAEMRQRTKAENVKAELVRRSIQRQEDDLQQWRQMIAEKAAIDENRASVYNQKTIEQRQRKVKADLAHKQHNHLSTKKKIDEQNKKMKSMLRKEIQAKDVRSEVLKEEKELTAQKGKQYQMNTLAKDFGHLSIGGRKDENFHEKAMKAELTHHILFNDKKLAYPKSE